MANAVCRWTCDGMSIGGGAGLVEIQIDAWCTGTSPRPARSEGCELALPTTGWWSGRRLWHDHRRRAAPHREIPPGPKAVRPSRRAPRCFKPQPGWRGPFEDGAVLQSDVTNLMRRRRTKTESPARTQPRTVEGLIELRYEGTASPFDQHAGAARDVARSAVHPEVVEPAGPVDVAAVRTARWGRCTAENVHTAPASAAAVRTGRYRCRRRTTVRRSRNVYGGRDSPCECDSRPAYEISRTNSIGGVQDGDVAQPAKSYRRAYASVRMLEIDTGRHEVDVAWSRRCSAGRAHGPETTRLWTEQTRVRGWVGHRKRAPPTWRPDPPNPVTGAERRAEELVDADRKDGRAWSRVDRTVTPAWCAASPRALRGSEGPLNAGSATAVKSAGRENRSPVDPEAREERTRWSIA